MGNKKKNLNIVEIAKKASVSIATVSRYFSDPNKLAKKTRMKLKKIIEEYAFYPSFISSRVTTIRIGFLYDPVTTIDYSFTLLRGLLRGCLIYNYTLIAFLEQSQREEHNTDNIIKNQIDMLVTTTIKDEDYVRIMKKNSVKLCFLLKEGMLKKTHIKPDDILISHTPNVDQFLLGLLAISFFKNTLTNKQKKFHVKLDDQNIIDLEL